MAVRPGSGSIKCSTLAFTILVVATLIVGLLTPAAAVTPKTRLISVSVSDSEEYAWSLDPAISGTGRFVAFRSSAANLVPNDTNGVEDVFVRDRKTGTTTRVSVRSNGEQINRWSRDPAISADGRFVTFDSVAVKLVPNDTNHRVDVFVHDLATGTTTRVSVSSDGDQGNGGSWHPAISADGRFVTFYSVAKNLISNDTNAMSDVFVHDMTSGSTTRVSVSSDGDQGNGDAGSPAISADARFVTFASAASNLVPNDTNAYADVFVHDRSTGTTERVSVSSEGGEASSFSTEPAISADGRFVAFVSSSTNLVQNDTNRAPDVFVHNRMTGRTTRVSVTSDENQVEAGASSVSQLAISGDGRFVAFTCHDAHMVPNDTNDTPDVFVRDRRTGTTRRVSLNSDGLEGNSSSSAPVLSADGRFLAFISLATNLVPIDTNDGMDVFVRGPLR